MVIIWSYSFDHWKVDLYFFKDSRRWVYKFFDDRKGSGDCLAMSTRAASKLFKNKPDKIGVIRK